jgi:hypothetical protein
VTRIIPLGEKNAFYQLFCLNKAEVSNRIQTRLRLSQGKNIFSKKFAEIKNHAIFATQSKMERWSRG